MEHLSLREGQSFLAVVIFIGGIVTVAALLIAFFAASAVDTGYGVAAAFNAESAATAGVEDGLLQLNRNSQFSNTSGYPVAVGTSTTATVTVTPSSSQTTILSAATVSGHTKKINVVVSVNSSTGAIDILSWTEIQ
jgi:hypothetical protein